MKLAPVSRGRRESSTLKGMALRIAGKRQVKRRNIPDKKAPGRKLASRIPGSGHAHRHSARVHETRGRGACFKPAQQSVGRNRNRLAVKACPASRRSARVSQGEGAKGAVSWIQASSAPERRGEGKDTIVHWGGSANEKRKTTRRKRKI